MRYARFIESGRRQRILDLRMRDGSKCRLRFNVRLEANSFAWETLRVSLAPRVRRETQRLRPASLVPGALVGAAVALLSTVVLTSVISTFF